MSQDTTLKKACQAYPDELQLRELFKELIAECPNQYSNDERGYQLFVGDIDQLVEYEKNT